MILYYSLSYLLYKMITSHREKLYLGCNNHFLNMNSFYAKFKYTQITFILIKQIQLKYKKFSWDTGILKNRELGNWGKKGDLNAQKSYLEHSLRRDGDSRLWNCTYTGTRGESIGLTMADQYQHLLVNRNTARVIPRIVLGGESGGNIPEYLRIRSVIGLTCALSISRIQVTLHLAIDLIQDKTQWVKKKTHFTSNLTQLSVRPYRKKSQCLHIQ